MKNEYQKGKRKKDKDRRKGGVVSRPAQMCVALFIFLVAARVGRLHDVVLRQAAMIGLHGVTTARLDVPDVAETQLTSAVLVALELRDCSVGGFGSIESDDTSASGAAAWFVLDFRLLDISDGAEELDEVLIARRPWELNNV